MQATILLLEEIQEKFADLDLFSGLTFTSEFAYDFMVKVKINLEEV